MRLSEKQSEAFEVVKAGQHNFVTFGGAVGGGKSIWLLACFVYLANRYPYSRWVIIRDSIPTLKRTIIQTFNGHFYDAGLAEHIVEYNRSEFKVTFKNGSEIIFMAENYEGDKELNRFKGLEVNGFGADEINELQEQTLDKMFERIGRWRPAKMKEFPPPIILATCNPANNWLRKRVYEPFIKDKLPSTWKFIVSKITDNPYLAPEYLENLKKNMTPINYRRFVEGDWDAKEVTNQFATQFVAEKHVKPAALDITKQLCISIDFNLNPFAMVAFHQWRDEHGFHFHIVGEASIEQGSIHKMIEHIKINYYPWIPTIMITGDYSGTKRDIGQIDNASNFEQIRRGLQIRESQMKLLPNPTHSNSRNEVNFCLMFHPDFRVDPKCEGVIFDLENVEVDSFGQIKKRDRNDPKQKADHLDTVRNAVHTFLSPWIKFYQQQNPLNK